MSETLANPLDDLAADPFEIAAEAADDIARLTGVPRHDIALTLGSGWGGAAELIGETVATIPATEVTGFSKPALEGHVGHAPQRGDPSGQARAHHRRTHALLRDPQPAARRAQRAHGRGDGRADDGADQRRGRHQDHLEARARPC